MRGGLGALLVGLTLLLAAPASAQAPRLQVPSAPVPSVPVPVPTAVPLPVPVPQVQLPPVVPQPSAPAPSLPAAPAPSAALPGNAPSAASGSTGRVRDTPVAPTAAGTTAASSAPAAASGPAAATASSSARAERRRDARERRFRHRVRELRGCLDTLPRLYRRVLVLRAGIGRQEVLTTAQTARRVDRRETAVRRIERRGLRRLRAADRDGLCAGAASDGTGATGALGAPAGGSELAVAGATSTGATGTAADGSAAGSGGSSSSGSGDTSSGDRGGVKGEQRESRERSRTRSFPGSLIAPPGKGIPAAFWIVLAAALVGWFAVTRIRRRRRIDRLRYY